MKKYIFIALSVWLSAYMVACGKGGSGGGKQIVGQCAAGQVLTPSGCAVSTILPMSSGPVGFLDQGAYLQADWRTFLKEVGGVCDLGATTGGWADCGSWTSGAIMVQAAPGQNYVNVTFGSRSSAYSGYTLPNLEDFFFGGSTAQQALTNTMRKTLQMQQGNDNNSQGFTLWGYAQNTYGWNKKIEIRVKNGKIEDSLLVYDMYYGGNKAASGTMYKCSNSACY
jgi:hypothetical protein